MSSYGAAVYSPSGSAYYLPRSSPFTFWKRVDQWVPAGAYWEDTYVYFPELPSGTVIRAFVVWHVNDNQGTKHCSVTRRGDGVPGIRLWANVNNGNTASVYIFSTVVPVPQSSSGSKYGIEFYDDNGRVVSDGGSRPLKTYRCPTYQHPGGKIAKEDALLVIRDFGSGTVANDVHNVFVDGSLNVMGRFISNSLYPVPTWNAGTYEYIRCSDYD